MYVLLDAPHELLEELYHGVAEDQELMAKYSLIEVTPVKDFITYGIGIPLLKTRDPMQARGRAPVSI